MGSGALQLLDQTLSMILSRLFLAARLFFPLAGLSLFGKLPVADLPGGETPIGVFLQKAIDPIFKLILTGFIQTI
ncbi:MAG: hypothetical protein IJG25_06860, partial [Thermoguttaceae bacterium]|nr:hypothetical protein [Thermoguttaceae bacterium]